MSEKDTLLKVYERMKIDVTNKRTRERKREKDKERETDRLEKNDKTNLH